MEMRKLTDRHNRERRKTVENNERQISELKKQYAEKKFALRTQGDAAISHIQNSTKRQIQSIDKSTNEQINYKQKVQKQRLDQLKTSHEKQARGLKRSLNNREESLNRQLTEIRNKKKQSHAARGRSHQRVSKTAK